MRPDGTWADALFKQHLNDPWAMEDVRSVPGTPQRKFVAIAAGHHTLPAGPVVVVTAAAGLNNPAGIRIVTPDVTPPEGGMSGKPVAEGGVRDHGGHYMTPWPLSDKYFLASYSYSNDVAARSTGILPRPGRNGLRALPDRRLWQQGTDLPRSGDLLLHAHRRCRLDRGLQSSPTRPIRTRSYATCTLSDAAFGCEGIDPRQVRYLRIAHPVAWPYDERDGGLRYETVALE